MIHIDERRTLIDWGIESKTAKTVIANKDCTLGNHYHKKKIEYFMLVAGKGELETNAHGYFNNYDMQIGEIYHVYPHVKHKFELKKGSVLMCLCSEPFDKNDDYED